MALNEEISNLKISLQSSKKKIVELDAQCDLLQDENRRLKNAAGQPFEVDGISAISPKKSSSDDEESGPRSNASMQQKTKDVISEVLYALENQSESLDKTPLSQDEKNQKNKKYEVLKHMLQRTAVFAKEYAIGKLKKKADEAGMSQEDVDDYVESVVEDFGKIFWRPE